MTDRIEPMVSNTSNAPPTQPDSEDRPSVPDSSASGSSFRFASSLNATNFAATLLILVGLLRAFSYVSGSTSIDLLGFATAAAPRPIVFVSGADQRCSFSAETESAKVVSRSYGPGLMQKIRGPMWRRYIYFRAMVTIPSDPHDVETLFKILRFGVCTDRTLAEDLGIDEPIRRFRFVRWHTRSPSATAATSDVVCEE